MVFQVVGKVGAVLESGAAEVAAVGSADVVTPLFGRCGGFGR